MDKTEKEDTWNKINIHKLSQLNTHLRNRITVHDFLKIQIL